MTQEDKDLLVKDLCARLPYGVKIKTISTNGSHRVFLEDKIDHYQWTFYIPNKVKPYLFPISSMTGEQRKEYLSLKFKAKVSLEANFTLIDWLNAHHFDYRGLIDKGLAIDATGLNIY